MVGNDDDDDDEDDEGLGWGSGDGWGLTIGEDLGEGFPMEDLEEEDLSLSGIDEGGRSREAFLEIAGEGETVAWPEAPPLEEVDDTEEVDEVC